MQNRALFFIVQQKCTRTASFIVAVSFVEISSTKNMTDTGNIRLDSTHPSPAALSTESAQHVLELKLLRSTLLVSTLFALGSRFLFLLFGRGGLLLQSSLLLLLQSFLPLPLALLILLQLALLDLSLDVFYLLVRLFDETLLHHHGVHVLLLLVIRQRHLLLLLVAIVDGQDRLLAAHILHRNVVVPLSFSVL